MITSINSPARIDAVKASANQLEIQVSRPATPNRESTPQARIVDIEMSTLDQSIKSGDAKKAELALFHVRTAIRQMISGTEVAALPEIGAKEDAAEAPSLSTYA